ncbi:MAG: aromatic amino acid hydroxylase [Bdellovibrionales bacterium]|nr:aromatic amino acid hydroxylase [Bdellovibrionales bacterium]
MEMPGHLKKYIVDQNYKKYTPEDQAVWRYIMNQIRTILSNSGHEDCLRGIEASGITYDKIPDIDHMDRELQKFGWRAAVVSGFIPPRAFMDFQIHGILPVASELRTIKHIGYTPAPDIVHEAVGHVPFLRDPVFSRFLKTYASTVKKALVSHEDVKQYTAIRALSDLKENPEAKEEEIKKLEDHLKKISSEISYTSEASLLSRFIWWTSEYGLKGSLNDPKIYGAGLISSVSEARQALSQKVKIKPLTKECLNYGYDITKFQPQLFVTPDFEHLLSVLEEITQTLSWKRGRSFGVQQAIQSQTVNTVELDSGLQISGCVEKHLSQGESVEFIKFKGPVQLCFQGQELSGQGKEYHQEGYSTPLQWIQKDQKPAWKLTDEELRRKGLIPGRNTELKFPSDITLKGELAGTLREKGELLLLTFKNCRVQQGETVLFHPDWGPFDLGLGTRVLSVFSGPADEKAYGLEDDFQPSVVPKRNFSNEDLEIFQLYRDIEALNTLPKIKKTEEMSNKLIEKLSHKQKRLWLAGLELLSAVKDFPEQKNRVEEYLDSLEKKHPSIKGYIKEGKSSGMGD